MKQYIPSIRDISLLTALFCVLLLLIFGYDDRRERLEVWDDVVVLRDKIKNIQPLDPASTQDDALRTYTLEHISTDLSAIYSGDDRVARDDTYDGLQSYVAALAGDYTTARTYMDEEENDDWYNLGTIDLLEAVYSIQEDVGSSDRQNIFGLTKKSYTRFARALLIEEKGDTYTKITHNQQTAKHIQWIAAQYIIIDIFTQIEDILSNTMFAWEQVQQTLTVLGKELGSRLSEDASPEERSCILSLYDRIGIVLQTLAEIERNLLILSTRHYEYKYACMQQPILAMDELASWKIFAEEQLQDTIRELSIVHGRWLSIQELWEGQDREKLLEICTGGSDEDTASMEDIQDLLENMSSSQTLKKPHGSGGISGGILDDQREDISLEEIQQRTQKRQEQTYVLEQQDNFSPRMMLEDMFDVFYGDEHMFE